MISAVANGFTAFAAVIGAAAAARGVQLWKRQLIGADEYHLAKSLLTLVYRMRLACNKLRVSSSDDSVLKFNKEESAKELISLWGSFEAELATARALWTDLAPTDDAPGFHVIFARFFTAPIFDQELPKWKDKESEKFDKDMKKAIDDFRKYLSKHLSKPQHDFEEF